MIEIHAHARLHFGLLDCGMPPPWVNVDGEAVAPGRRFGGVGLMIDQPRLTIRARPAATWQARGPLADRVLAVARRLVQAAPPATVVGRQGQLTGNIRDALPSFPPLEFVVDEAPPEHCGFGSGTQLELAVAWAMAASVGNWSPAPTELARWTGRGQRSAIGVHGFARGGFLVESGKREETSVAPLVFQAPLPSAWRVVVALLDAGRGRFGEDERWAFDQLPPIASSRDTLCRMILLEMIPALLAADCRLFGEAVYDLNARVGEMFAHLQGGRYAFALATDAIRRLRAEGLRGVGQSSWGPAIFAIVEDDQRAEWTRRLLTDRYPTGRVWIAQTAGPARLTH